MNSGQLSGTAMDPATRRVLPVRVCDGGGQEESVTLSTMLMGKGEASSRREWMEAKGDTVEADV